MNKTCYFFSVSPSWSSHSALALLVSLPCVATSLGCSVVEPPAEKPSLASTATALAGDDGDRVVDAADTVLNAYAALDEDVAVGSATLTVNDVGDLALDTNDDGTPEPLAAGDRLLVIQMQGASIRQTDTVTYGELTNLGGAGLYEFVTVGSVNAGTDTITLNAALCTGGLRNDYTVAGRTQIVRVPEYASLTVNAGASVVAPAWNGSVGGIVALDVVGATTLTGTASIDVSGRGLRGGSTDAVGSLDAGTGVAGYRYTGGQYGGEKGESVAGYRADYTLGRYGRGAPANGGGGGNSHNAGGGGGSNPLVANAGWTGLGVMDDAYATAWGLEVTPLANSPGGGRGGYSYSNDAQDPTLLGPSEAAWLGDGREIVGGIGGRGLYPLDPPLATERVFPGGGGGAGDANDGLSVGGGRGGGIVFLFSGTVGGQGDIIADGAAGGSATAAAANNDAAGGGGGGGTVIVRAASIGNVSIRAEGGAGGDQVFTTPAGVVEAEGPGGGGGGGHVVVVGAAATPSVAGGVNGTTNSPPFDPEFPPNGATSGGDGSVSSLATASFPLCTEAISVVLTDTLTEVPTSGETSYTLTVTSQAASPLTDLAVVLPAAIPTAADFTLTGWTCSTPDGSDDDDDTCGAEGLAGTASTATIASLQPGATVVYTVTGTVVADAGDTLTTQGTVTVGATAFSATDTTAVVAAEPPTITAPTTGVTTPEDTDYVFAPGETSITFDVPGPASQTVTVTLAVSDTGNDGNGTLTLSPDAGLIFTDGDGTDDATMTFSGTPAAVNAALEDALFNPTPDYNGDDTTITVSIARAGGDPVVATIPVTVTPVNDAPVAVDDAISSLPNDGIIDVLGNDTDVDGDTLTVTAASDPARGTVVVNDNGTLTYTPNPGATGTDTITYTISDGHEGTDEGSITIELGGGADTDGDGLSDSFEETIGTDPNDADSDDDGAIDGLEVDAGADTDEDGLINALDPDSDNDGLFDGTELGQTCDAQGTNNAAGFCVEDADAGATVTDPADPDTDGGGATDGSEDFNLNGRVDAGETNPTTGNQADDAGVTDTDGDGLSNGMENALDSDPNDADTDNDGVVDGLEANPSADMDGDTHPDVLDPDSDGDGLFDGTEMGHDCSNEATDAAAGFCIADGDSGTSTTSPVNPDTDGGSIDDGLEDADRDGVFDDPGETDPNDDTDDLCTADADCGSDTSGRICQDDVPRVCIDGCRATDGNGCPDGYACTSTDETAGDCEVIETGTGGAAGAGGAGGDAGSAGTPAAGGTAGAPVTGGEGGVSGAAGAPVTGGEGGVSGAAGSPATGGTTTAGGSPATGGTTTTGGSPATGGTAGGAGAPPAGGDAGSAGTPTSGGRSGAAGGPASGGEAGAAGTSTEVEPPETDNEPVDSLEGGGCACSVKSQSPRAHLWATLGLALALFGRARRRTRR